MFGFCRNQSQFVLNYGELGVTDIEQTHFF